MPRSRLTNAGPAQPVELEEHLGVGIGFRQLDARVAQLRGEIAEVVTPPLNTSTTWPSALSIGWLASVDRSMIESRLCPSTAGPLSCTPDASGPR